MGTKFLSPGWRMPKNANQSKITNYSLDFDGTDHINAGRILSAENTSTLSVSFWLKIPSTGAKSYLGYFIGNFGAGWLVEADSSSMYFVVGDTSYQAFTLPYSGNIAINTWYHIVMVYDGNQTGSANILKVYINGTQKTLSGSPSFPSSIPTLSGAEFTIGGIKPTSVNGVKSISSVSIFDYALSQSQVTTLWGGGTEVSNPMALPSSPVAYYPLGTSAWNGQYLAENNAIGDYVFDFENSNNHYISGSASLPNSDYTISAWINLETVTTESIVTWGEDATGKRRSLFIWNGGSGAYKLYSSTYGSNIPGSTTLLTGQWYHAAVTVSSAAVAKIYLNGSLDGTGTNILNSFTGTNFYIGRTPSSEYFDGKISNVQIFNTVLSGPEVETLYNYGSPIQTLSDIPQNSDLELWYKLDASATYNSSTTTWSIPDDSSNSNTGISSGMSQSNLIQSDLQTVAPYSKYAMNFRGDPDDDYIQVGTSDAFSLTDMTISFWFNASSIGSSTRWIWQKCQSTATNNYGVYVEQVNSTKYVILWDDIDNRGTAPFLASINENQWYNVTLTMESLVSKMYLNGSSVPVYEERSATASDNLASITAPFRIGINVPSTVEFFQGSISNGSVWDAALTPAQITEIYNQGLPSNLNSHSAYSNLVSWWQLGENSSFDGNNWICADEKGSNNGTSSNMPEAALTNGVGTTANGTSTGMAVGDLVGDAPYSTANAISSGMPVTSRGTNIP